MNKFRKIAIGALLATGAGCLTVAAAGCNREPDYFKLTFQGNGLDYVFQGELAPESGEQFVSGYLVKSGVEVRFTLALSENTEGTPVILLNGSEITADEDGVYSFILDQESVVSVSGLTEKKKITFSNGDYYKFIGEDGEEISNIMAAKGSSVKFKVWVSPYVVPEFTITSNTEELEADKDGFYTISNVTDDSTVNISTLNQADSFIERGDGTGTEADPFLIKEPIDMFMVAALVNSDFYTAYSTAYYRLENDIDMQGEKLFVIGDMSNANAIFCGSFDGNGHKISNFYLTDEVTDQESFAKEYLPYVGVFGAAVATTGGPVVIKNLTIEDYEINVHPALASSTEQSYQTGSLVAYGIGAQIDNCHAKNGKITSLNDDKKTCNVGGLVGVLQSAYDGSRSTVLTYDAYVNGCSADVKISGSGVLYCVGGAVGMLATADTQAIAYVSNTVTSGSVSGTIFVGGVVGNLSRFSSVANCYSSSAVTAKNTNNTAGMVELIKSANAGGIVGYAENDTVITGCYSANTAISASSANSNKFASKGAICAKREEALSQASDAAVSVLFNNLAKADGSVIELGWSEEEWDLTAETPIYKGAANRKITLTVKNDGGTIDSFQKTISSPAPVYTWYGEEIDEYITTSEGRSWGYYFDAALTQRVPNGFVPLGDTHLYVGLADYSKAAGQYYLGTTKYGVNAYLTLDDEGGYFFRDGGMTYAGTYSYDGEKITLYYSCLGAMAYTADETNGSYTTIVMEKDGSGYKLSGKIYVRQFTGDTDYTTSLQELSFTATKKSDTFTYGEYTNSAGGKLVLKPNGTGTYTVRGSSSSFTFTITEGGVENSKGLSITVTGDKVTSFMGYSASLKDGFAGSWKTSAGSAIEYVFDGFGSVKCGGETVTYEGDDTAVTFTLNGKEIEAVLEGDALYIDGVAYYLSDGFTGTWTGSTSVNNERFELTLGGIGKDGYGEAEITFYAGVNSTVSGQYSVTDDGVMVLYVGDTLYGELTYNKLSNTATGSFYSLSEYNARNQITYVSAEFALYDLFRGVWECNVEGVNKINFTGKTAGGKSATAIVTYTNGRTGEAVYSLETATSGQLTIDGKTYGISLDETANRVALSLDGEGAGSLALKDEWSGVTLYDGQTAYTFDGRGKLGGKVSVTGGTSLTYSIGADGMPVIDGTPLVANQDDFSWGDKTLAFKTGFANTWLMAGDNSRIIIGEVKADFTAKLTVENIDYTLIYNPERNTLSFTSMDRKGVVTVMTIGLQGGKELSISVSGSVNQSVNCITEGALDSWIGEYTAADGSSWTFDGHGLAEYGSGKAIYNDKNGKKTTYSYRQNSLGLVQILTGTSNGMVFTEVTEGGYKRDGSTLSYAPVTANTMYLTEVRLNGEYVTLDGVGNIWSSTPEKTKYTYTYLTTLSDVSYLVIKDDKGEKSLGVITKSGGINELTLNDFVEWTLRGTDKKYIFVGGKTGTLWRVDGDDYVREYYYESDSQYEVVFFLTDMDENDYKMTLKKADNTFALEELKDEN